MKISDILNKTKINESTKYVSGRDFTLVPGTKFHGYVMGDESITDEDSRKAMYGVYKYINDTKYTHNGTEYTQKNYERVCGLVDKKTNTSPTPYGADYKKIYRSTVMQLVNGKKSPDVDAKGEELSEMWPFTKKNVKNKTPSKYPKADDDLVQWMHDKIEYYVTKGYDPSTFFSPTCAEYFPLLIQIGTSYSGKAVDAYHEIKKEYPELVKRAKERHTTPLSLKLFRSRVGDPDDFITTDDDIMEDTTNMPSNADHTARVNAIVNNIAAQGHKVVNQTHDNSDPSAHRTTIEYIPKKTGMFAKQQPNKTINVNTTKTNYNPSEPQKTIGNTERRQFRGQNTPK